MEIWSAGRYSIMEKEIFPQRFDFKQKILISFLKILTFSEFLLFVFFTVAFKLLCIKHISEQTFDNNGVKGIKA